MPRRRCIGCGAVRPKAELLRLALDTPDGGTGGDRVVADRSATLPGRGAYVCDAACYERAVARRALARAFRRPVAGELHTLDSLR